MFCSCESIEFGNEKTASPPDKQKRIINKTKNGLCIIYFKYKRIDFMLNKLENVSYKSFDNYTSEDDLTGSVAKLEKYS